MSESLNIVFDAYGENFEDYALESESYLSRSTVHARFLHLSYFLIVALSYSMYLYFNELERSHFGPIVIIFSTLVTGVHILYVQKILQFFDQNDPAYGSMHLQRLKNRAEKIDSYKPRFLMSSNNYLSRKNCSKIIANSISYEILLASYGTFVWGFL